MSNQSDNSIFAKPAPGKGAVSCESKSECEFEERACTDRLALSKLSIDVVKEQGHWNGLEPIGSLIDETARAITKHLGRSTLKDSDGVIHQATLALTSDTHIAELNKDFRGKPTPTNVLSFQNSMNTSMMANHKLGKRVYLGDIVMAEQTILKEASNLNIPFKSHFQHLLVHGVLHLAGYDHETEDNAQQMEALEIRILNTIGIPDPYSDRV